MAEAKSHQRVHQSQLMSSQRDLMGGRINRTAHRFHVSFHALKLFVCYLMPSALYEFQTGRKWQSWVTRAHSSALATHLLYFSLSCLDNYRSRSQSLLPPEVLRAELLLPLAQLVYVFHLCNVHCSQGFFYRETNYPQRSPTLQNKQTW